MVILQDGILRKTIAERIEDLIINSVDYDEIVINMVNGFNIIYYLNEYNECCCREEFTGKEKHKYFYFKNNWRGWEHHHVYREADILLRIKLRELETLNKNN